MKNKINKSVPINTFPGKVMYPKQSLSWLLLFKGRSYFVCGISTPQPMAK